MSCCTLPSYLTPFLFPMLSYCSGRCSLARPLHHCSLAHIDSSFCLFSPFAFGGLVFFFIINLVPNLFCISRLVPIAIPSHPILPPSHPSSFLPSPPVPPFFFSHHFSTPSSSRNTTQTRRNIAIFFIAAPAYLKPVHHQKCINLCAALFSLISSPPIALIPPAPSRNAARVLHHFPSNAAGAPSASVSDLPVVGLRVRME